MFAAGSRAFPLFEKLYYVLPILLIYFVILGFKEIKSNKYLRTIVLLLLSFSVWCLITAIWSQYPLITISRSLYFALISIGSVTGSYLYVKPKNEFNLNFLLPLNIFIIFLSLISLIFNVPKDSWSGGNGMGFMGLASHQNILGAAILFTIPAPMFLLIERLNEWKINSKFKIQNSKIIFFALLLIFNFSFLILTDSRASILSFLLIVGLILYNIINLKIFLILTSVFCLLTSVIYFLPVTHNTMHDFLFKNETFFGDHRYFMYGDSFRAALDGGFTGLGYGVSDPAIHNAANGSHYENMPEWMLRMGNVISTEPSREKSYKNSNENKIYIREKGNSVLAMVEETGMIGLIIFLLPVGYLLSKLKIQNSKFKISRATDIAFLELTDNKLQTTHNKLKPVTDNQQTLSSNQYPVTSIQYILFASICAFILHGMFEAWWVGAGSFELPVFMVYIGLILPLRALR